MSEYYIKIAINLAIFVFLLLISIVLLSVIKFQDKGYKYLFVIYILFWIPIMLVRPYRGTIQNLIDKTITWLPLAAYGFIGIFLRPIFDFYSLKFKNRKIFIQLAIVLVAITYLPMIFVQNSATNVIQSLGVGIGASMIGIYELFFKEQYSRRKSFLTVSILALPPLIADFLTAPLQSLVSSFAKETNVVELTLSRYSIMWIAAVAITLLVFFMSFFLKERKQYAALNERDNDITLEKNSWQKTTFSFAIICFIGFLILLIKFSNSGSIGLIQLQNYGKIKYGLNNKVVSTYEGYLSTVFSTSQIFGTFVFGYFSIKNKNKNVLFLISIFSWLTYYIISTFFHDPEVYIAIHSLNGFSYGIIYNIFLAKALATNFKSKKITAMGIYQSFAAIGITLSGPFTEWIKTVFKVNNKIDFQNQIINATLTTNMIVICLLLIITALYFLNYKYFEKQKKYFIL